MGSSDRSPTKRVSRKRGAIEPAAAETPQTELVPWTGPTPLPLHELPRAELERAFVKLAEENARLRREVLANGSLWQVAHQDVLTGLWNRRYADDRLAEEMSRSRRENRYRFAVVVVDVDNLKRINDQAGHAAGDEALRLVAGFLREGLRLHDICARLGGDEFLLVLPACGEKEAQNFLDRLERRWRAAAEQNAALPPISAGAASYPAQGANVPDLLAVADDAMYAQKRRRNPVHALGGQATPTQVTRI